MLNTLRSTFFIVEAPIEFLSPNQGDYICNLSNIETFADRNL